MKPVGPKLVIAALVLAAAGAVAVAVHHRVGGVSQVPGTGGGGSRPAPVEVAAIERGSIALLRTYSGELEALASVVVAPKVAGRVERVFVNIADAVTRGQLVAELDDAEYVQAVAQAGADLEVARANQAQARSALEIAEREFRRTESLVQRGIASASEFDAVRQERLAKRAQVTVGQAQVEKARAALETANIRLGYTRVTAGWTGGGDRRFVAERFVDEGQTLAANTPLLRIVELDPIVGIVFVTERDYGLLQTGQPVSLTTDAYPGERFSGRIDRIAPVFRTSTRQARVEMTVDNGRRRLKPGMFIRATVEFDRVDGAVIVPESALTLRDGKTGVFVVDGDGRTVRWREVRVGIRDGDRVQVEGDGLEGRVVTLGQQLVADGAPVEIAGGPGPVPGRGTDGP